ncbi:hypothetical protein JHN63_15100 [Streptomyces sp. MBT65]|uniref:hypothetical protein n=1 Tax=Streptomyces sp. MBT65 TaxID=1488395 RepID=UPI001909DE3E|nr:hypothetical protein [Streptomyces sp. MBT65]MBK3575115.1 hypothetical protein [Streptomyces sp. MBT65]
MAAAVNRREQREQLDDEIAALLRAGATHQHIVNTLNVGNSRVVRVRSEHGIPLPPGRAKRTRAELDTLAGRATAMLRAGATYQQIRDATRLDVHRICALRKQHRIPVPDRRPNRPTTPAAPAPSSDIDTLYDSIFHPGATP